MARLERTQKPISLLVEELKQGGLGFPEIQRGYVWNRSQARDLIDSLYREYPSGLILLWKPEEPPELREGLGGPTSRRRPDYLIIDGQQRLTSLSRVFDGTINVYFNVEDEAFQVYSTKLKANPLWVSVKDVLNGGAITALLNLQRSSNLDVEKQTIYGQRLERLAKLKDYLYPVMIIHTDDYHYSDESLPLDFWCVMWYGVNRRSRSWTHDHNLGPIARRVDRNRFPVYGHDDSFPFWGPPRPSTPNLWSMGAHLCALRP